MRSPELARRRAAHIPFCIPFSAKSLSPVVLSLVVLSLVVPSRAFAEADPSVPSGTTHVGDVVALGKRVEMAGVENGSVVAVGGTVIVDGRIQGNLILLLGANATVTGRGHVDGDLVAVGGEVAYRDGATEKSAVGGRVRTVEALEAAYLTELRTSPVEASAFSPL